MQKRNEGNPYRRYSLVSENEFITKALTFGYDMAIPYNPESIYDLILDNGDDLLKIQVKTSLSKDKDGIYRVELKRKRNIIEKARYEKGDVDFFAIHLFKDNVWFLLPYTVVGRFGRLFLRSDENEGYDKYEAYRDNWSVFNSQKE